VGYDDETRRDVITNFVGSLLSCYQTVVRVDADEFLVVDPRLDMSLASYIDQVKLPFVTARGFDVIQLPSEADLLENQTSGILENRGYAHPNSALNKTCITKTKISWSSGFHFTNLYPQFGPLFMLHMKRLDIEWQMNWFEKMFGNIKDNPKVHRIFKEYYTPDREKITNYHKGVDGRPRLNGIESWYRNDFNNEFLNSLVYSVSDQRYHGTLAHEMVLCSIPAEWKLLF
jgi:hypothetical protein